MIYLTYAVQIIQVILIISFITVLFVRPERKNLNAENYEAACMKHRKLIFKLSVVLAIAALANLAIQTVGV